MTKYRMREITDDRSAYRVPVGNKNCTALIAVSDMDALVKEYGDLAFFQMNHRGPICVRWKKKNRVVSRLILKADSRYRIKHADSNKLNLLRNNLILVKKKKSKLEGIRRHDHRSSSDYVDPFATGLASNSETYGDYTPVGKQEPTGLNLNNDDKNKVLVELVRLYFKATDASYKQERLTKLYEAFLSLYGKLPRKNPDIFLTVFKKYDPFLTMEDLKELNVI